MSYRVLLDNKAKKDLKKYRGTPYVKSINDIFDTLKNNPFEVKHSFEKLTPPGKGFYSRRVNVQDRVVYSVDKENMIVKVFSIKGHYE